MREKLVELKNVSVDFGSGRKKLRAVNEVSFDIYRGETFGLVGESGSGKTTIGRAIIRIHPTATGEITFNGQRINGKIDKQLDRDITRKIQMIFQDPYSSLNPRWQVSNIIAEPLETHNIGTKAEQAAKNPEGYYITDACIGCGSCAAVCPQNCIITDSIPHVIEQEHCLHCGNCMEACPVGAVIRK